MNQFPAFPFQTAKRLLSPIGRTCSDAQQLHPPFPVHKLVVHHSTPQSPFTNSLPHRPFPPQWTGRWCCVLFGDGRRPFFKNRRQTKTVCAMGNESLCRVPLCAARSKGPFYLGLAIPWRANAPSFHPGFSASHFLIGRGRSRGKIG